MITKETPVLTQEFQNWVIFFALTDPKFLRSIREILSPDMHHSGVTQLLLQLIYDFHDAYKVPPGIHIRTLLEQYHDKRNIDDFKQKINSDYLEKILEFEGGTPEYVYDMVSEFVRLRNYDIAGTKIVDLVSERKSEDVELLLRETLRKKYTFEDDKDEVNRDFLADYTDLITRTEEEEPIMPLGIQALDYHLVEERRAITNDIVYLSEYEIDKLEKEWIAQKRYGDDIEFNKEYRHSGKKKGEFIKGDINREINSGRICHDLCYAHGNGGFKGIKRSQFVIFLAGTKVGKSWCLVHMGKVALMQGLKVLHISHELTMRELQKRYDQAFSSCPSSSDNLDIWYDTYQPDNEAEDIQLVFSEVTQKIETKYMPTKFPAKQIRRFPITDIDKVVQYRKTMRRFGGELRLKKYPMSSAKIEDIERMIEDLIEQGFKPDVIINDYIDLMIGSVNQKEPRHALNQLYQEHKRLADTYNCAVLSVSQTNRSGLKQKVVGIDSIAEDFRKAANVDVCISLTPLGTADPPEPYAKTGLIWMEILLNRDGKQNFGCVVRQNLEVGQFCLWSTNERLFV